MSETIINLERLPESSEEECLDFLRCLYSHLEHGPDRDRSADAKRKAQISDGLQEVPVQIAGDDNFDTARAAISAAAQACDPNWSRLYRFAD